MSNNIYYGSLEQRERERILQDNKRIEEETADTSNPNRIPQLQQLNQSNNQNVQKIQISKEQYKKQQDMNKKLEIEKQIRNIIVPTNDKEVKLQLRELNVPICYFGEDCQMRRERLKKLYENIYRETGQLPQFKRQQIQIIRKKDYQEGDDDLYDFRMKVCNTSIKNSSLRIQTNYQEEDKQIQQINNQMDQFQLELVQYCDKQFVSQGNLIQLYDEQFYGTAGGTGDCNIYDYKTGDLLIKLQDHKQKANDIQSNGQILATCSSDQFINIYRVNQNKVLQNDQENMDVEQDDIHKLQLSKLSQRKIHSDRINKIIFHNLNNYLLSCSNDCLINVNDIEKQKVIYQQQGHSKGIYTMSLHQDGSLLYSGDQSGVGILWDLRIGKQIYQLQGHVKQILCSDFNINGYQLATGGDDNIIKIWDIRRKQNIQSIPAHLKLISDLKFQKSSNSNQQSNYLISSSYDGGIKIWNTKNWNLINSLVMKDSKITSVDITSDSKNLLVTTQQRQWSLWKNNKLNQ